MAERITITVAAGGDDAEARAFGAALNDILDILDSIAKEVGGKSTRIEWHIVGVSKNSPVSLTLENKSRVAVVNSFLNGWEKLQSKPIRSFPIRGMRAARRLGRRIKNKTVDSVVIESPTSKHAPIATSEKVADNAQRAIDDRFYYAPSSIDGKLDIVNVHSRAKFGVFDNLHMREIRCHFPPRLFDKVKANLGRRVSVIGQVKFDTETDRPIAITVEEIDPLDDGNPLLFSEMPKIDLTGGVPSEQCMRRLRDG